MQRHRYRYLVPVPLRKDQTSEYGAALEQIEWLRASAIQDKDTTNCGWLLSSTPDARAGAIDRAANRKPGCAARKNRE